MKKAEAVKHFGDTKKLARALNITPSSIYQWGETIPPLRAFQIERITKGKLRAVANHQ
ncbi:Cro/CI family transcriptional regulator [Algicola sagamiensis]|uniref:Cro/CI family transcriptional regulator n=1 Tax=Algicola sagamiensis TaxID=163869 RepID=UPI00037D3878|nr:Cro/CI family transcriptional regulator [Algicola sagamiensis]